MSRLRLTSVLAVVLAAAGCAEGNREHGTLEITAPASGARFDLTSDLLENKPGVQIAARVVATGLDGRSVALRATQGTATAPAVTVSDGAAEFEVTISGNATIEAYATAEDGSEVKSVPVSFTFDPATVLCRILVPADGATLGAGDDQSELAGFQTQVEVRCLGVETGNPIELSVGGNLWSTIPLGAGGRVTFPAVELAEGANTIEIHTRTNAGSEARATAAVTVDTGSCRLVVSPPTGTVFNARGEANHVADLTAGAPMNAKLSVESTCATGTIEIRRGETLVASAPAATGTVTIPVELADGTAELRAIAVDGTPGTSPLVRYTVDAVVPTGSFTAPAANAQLVDADDASPGLPGLQADVRGAFVGIDPGTSVSVELLSGGERFVTQTTVLQGGAFRTTLTLPNGSHRVTATAARPSGTTATATIDIRSNFLGASLAIAAPAAGETFPLARDASTDAGYQLKVGLAGTNLSGATGTVTCGGATAPFTVAANGTAQATVTLNVTECAGRTVTCSATATRNNSTFTSGQVSVKVDPTPPVVTLVRPTDGALLDSQTMTFEATTDCAGESQTVTLARGAVVLHGPAAIAANAVTADVSLPFGESALALKVVDGAGNETTVPFTVFVDGTAPVVTFVAPVPADPAELTASADTDSDLSNGLQTDVVIEVANEPVGTQVSLRIGERAAVTVRTALDGNRRRTATFEDVTLPEGDSTLEACASDGAGAETCATLNVRVSTGRPVCNLETPSDGAVLAASDDEEEDAGLQTELSVTTNAEDGQTVTIDVVGPNGTTTLQGTVAGGAAIIPATFDSEGAWRLVAGCTNEAGASSKSLENAVRVDYTAPVVTLLEPADGAAMNLATPDRSAAAGFQIDLEGATDAEETGALAFVTVSCGAGPVELEPVAVEGSAVLVPAVTLPDEGACDLTLVVEDAAGNRSEPVTHHVTVDRVAPVIVVDAPLNGSLLGKARDANLATPEFELDRVTVRVTGSNANPALTIAGSAIAGGTFTGTPPAQVTAGWTFVSLAEGANDLVLTATDVAGNTTTTTVTVTVDTVAPNVSIAGLSNNIALPARSDSDPATPGLQYNVQLAGERLDNGTTVRACSPQAPAGAAACKTGTGRVLASSVLTGGTALIPNVTFPEGTVEIYAEAESVAGNTARSTTITVRVDSVAPIVRELKVLRRTGETLADQTSGSVTLGPAADADAATPGLQARLTARIEGVEPDLGLTARFFTSNPAPNTPVGAPIFVPANGIVTLDVTLPEGGHRIHVATADRLGNANSTPDRPIAGDAPTFVNVAVDLAAPTLALVAPRPGKLLVAADRDTATAGLQFEVQVDSDAGAGRTVELLVDGSAFDTLALPLTGTTGSKIVTIPEGSHTLVARVSDVAGNTTTTGVTTVLVDSVGPTVAIAQPTTGQTIATDANPAADGFQISVQVTFGSVEDGRPVVLLSSTGGQLASGVTNAAGMVNFPPLTVQPGVQVLTARVSDVNGNTTTSAPVSITIDSNGPSVAFATAGNPLWFGTDDGVAGGNCSVTIAANSNTEGATVALLVNGTASGTATVASGVATFAGVVIAPGTPVTLQLRATDDQSRTGFSATREARCDLTAPTVAFADPSGTAVVSYVAFGNPGAVVGARVDKLATPALEADITVNTTGATGGLLVLTGSIDGELARDEIGSDTESVTFTSVAIPSGGAQTLTARVVDEAGNSASATLSIDVDVLAPGAANAASDVLDGRAGRVKLLFPAPGGDGSSGAQVAAYVVKVAEAAITTPEAWTAARTLAPETFAISAPGLVQELVVKDLALEKQWFFAVRALDAKGNLGPFGTTPDADLRLDRLVVAAGADWAATTDGLKEKLLVVDLDHDGFDDVVSANSTSNGNLGAVYVTYGGSTPGTPVKLQPATSQRFGSAISAGDLTGDGIPELVIGAEFETTGRSTAGARDGAVYILTGAAGSRFDANSLASATRILGKAEATDSTSASFGFSVQVVDDLTNDGVADLVVGNPGFSAFKGRLSVYAGRATFPATLAADTDAISSVTPQFPATNGPALGYQIVSMGDLNGDGFGDVAASAQIGTPTTTDAPKPIYVLSGKLLVGPVIAEQVSSAVYPVSASTLHPAAGRFGAGLVAADVTGDGKRDLVALDVAATQNKLYVFDGAAITLPTVAGGAMPDRSAARLVVTTLPIGEGTGTPYVSALADVTGDGRDELAVANMGTNTGNVMWVWYGRTTGWGDSVAPLAPSLAIRGTTSNGTNFGGRCGSGHILSETGPRDIAVLAGSGAVTILSGP